MIFGKDRAGPCHHAQARAHDGRRAILILNLVGSTVGTFIWVRKYAPNGCDQTLEFDRFGIELIAPRCNGLLALAGQRMRGHADDRGVVGLWIVLWASHGFPAVDYWHFEVHQN